MIKIVILIIIIGLAIAALIRAAGKKTPGKSDIKICIYNDQVKCYRTPCKYCSSFKECRLVCSGDCHKCEGLKVDKKK